jgi:hypothetical protein
MPIFASIELFKEVIQEPNFSEKLAEEVFWVEKTHEAVREGLEIYLQMLEHSNDGMAQQHLPSPK